jgi:hypothetical protein
LGSPGPRFSGRTTVSLADPRRVGLERRRAAAAVPETTGDGSQIDTRGEQLGRVVVTQVVQGRVHAQSGGQALEALRDRVGQVGPATVGVEREDVGVGAQPGPERRRHRVLCREVVSDHGQGLVVQRDATPLMGLRVLSPRRFPAPVDVVVEHEDGVVELDVLATKGTQLPPATTGGHGDPQEQPPLRVDTPCLHEESRGLRGSRRIGVAGGRVGRLSRTDGADPDPPPPHGPLERTRKDPVDLAHGRCRQRPAHVRTAGRRALVLPHHPVVNPGPARAPGPAPTQLRVERVEGLPVDTARLELPQHRADVSVDVADVGRARRLANVEHLLVAVEELVHGRPRSRIAAFVDLAQQPRPHLLGLGGCPRAGRDDLDEVVLPLRQRDPIPRTRALGTPRWAAGRPSRASVAQRLDPRSPSVP